MTITRRKRFPGVRTIKKKMRFGFACPSSSRAREVLIQFVEGHYWGTTRAMAHMFQYRGTPEAVNEFNRNPGFRAELELRFKRSRASLRQSGKPWHCVSVGDKLVQYAGFGQSQRRLVGVTTPTEGTHILFGRMNQRLL